MRTSEPSLSNSVHAKLLEHLAAEFTAFRRVNKAGRWIPVGLRSQVVAALNAGVSTGAIERACKVSRAQLTLWRAGDGVVPQPRVLSVIDGIVPAPSLSETSIELRVGAWRISLGRATD